MRHITYSNNNNNNNDIESEIKTKKTNMYLHIGKKHVVLCCEHIIFIERLDSFFMFIILWFINYFIYFYNRKYIPNIDFMVLL